LKIIQNLAGKRLDPETVAALMAVYERGEIRIQRISFKRAVAAADAATVAVPEPAPTLSAAVPTLERTRV
jgi:hypothetical protein